MNKKILMASCNYWTSPFQVGSHHLAKGFVKLGWDVAFISDPISPFHLLGGTSDELKSRFAIYKNSGIVDMEERLWAYVPGALLTPHNKPLLRTEWVFENWVNLTSPNVVKKVKEHGFDKVDILYFDSITQFPWIEELEFNKSVLRIADNNAGFGKFSNTAKKIEHKLAEKVDLVVYTASSLKEYVENLRPKEMLHLPNGVNFNHFKMGLQEKPLEYLNIPHPIALYIGAIDVWFDFETFNKIAGLLPHVSFVLIGPDKLAREKIKPFKNVYILGKRDYSELPPYIYNADLGLIPFNVKEFPKLVNGINPLKLYEYMACGLPVVATEWEELKHLGSPAFLCKSSNDYIDSIEKIIKDKLDREQYIKYASQFDWSERVVILLEKLGWC